MNATEIAKGLSAVQKAALLAKRETPDYFWTPDARTAKAILRKGIVCNMTYYNRAEFTPVGLEVRAILEGEKG
jgi:hypothetical protein